MARQRAEADEVVVIAGGVGEDLRAEAPRRRGVEARALARCRAGPVGGGAGCALAGRADARGSGGANGRRARPVARRGAGGSRRAEANARRRARAVRAADPDARRGARSVPAPALAPTPAASTWSIAAIIESESAARRWSSTRRVEACLAWSGASGVASHQKANNRVGARSAARPVAAGAG